jgi:hypothetical protein
MVFKKETLKVFVADCQTEASRMKESERENKGKS